MRLVDRFPNNDKQIRKEMTTFRARYKFWRANSIIVSCITLVLFEETLLGDHPTKKWENPQNQ